MNSESEAQALTRAVVPIREAGMILLTILSGCGVLVWLGLAWAAVGVGGICDWTILPIAIIGAVGSGAVCAWSVRRRNNEEPALIIDESGLFDNISFTKAGRIKWSDLERVWVAGPNWFPVLCLLPEDVWAFMERQDDLRGALMKFNKAVFSAPVIIPAGFLHIPLADLWDCISQVEGATRHRAGTSAVRMF